MTDGWLVVGSGSSVETDVVITEVVLAVVVDVVVDADVAGGASDEQPHANMNVATTALHQ